MAETPKAGLSNQAAYLLCTYLLRRQEFADLGAGRSSTACDELLAALDATEPAEAPDGENVVSLFQAKGPTSPAFEELRTLVKRVRRLKRPTP